MMLSGRLHWLVLASLALTACPGSDPDPVNDDDAAAEAGDDDDDDDDDTEGDDDDDDCLMPSELEPSACGDDDDDDDDTTGDDDDDDDDTTGGDDGICSCFEALEFSLDLLCEAPTSCGVVTTPVERSGGTTGGGALDPETEAANLEAMSCLLTAHGQSESASLQRLSQENAGQYEYRRTLHLYPSGEAALWDDDTEDLTQEISPVRHLASVGAIAECTDDSDSLAQWACIDAALEAAEVLAECTEAIFIDDI